MKINGKVSKEFETFVQEVSEQENLAEWTLEIWDCKSESECDSVQKIIYFGLCDTLFKTKWLFLHEVAHALASTEIGSKDWEDSLCYREKVAEGICSIVN